MHPNPRRPLNGGRQVPSGVGVGKRPAPSGGPGVGSEAPLLDNWEVLPDGRFKGAVYGRKGFSEGQEVTTGAVAHRSSTEITTNSGSKYRLGKPKTPLGARDGNSAGPSGGAAAARGGGNNNRGGGGGGGKPEWKGAIDNYDDEPVDQNEFPEVRRNNGGGAHAHNNPPPPKKILGQGGGGGSGGGGSGGGLGRADAGAGLDSTLKQFQQEIYVGDRVSVRNHNHLGQGGQGRRGSLGQQSKGMPQGVAMFIGPCGFAEGREMVGLRMDDRPLGGNGHDGKEAGERHFRCEPGMGCFVLKADVELVSRGGVVGKGVMKFDDEDDPDAVPFDLEASLTRLVGIESVKAHLSSLRNRLEVGRRRAAFGVQDHKSLHTVMVGSKGMDYGAVASVFGGLFKSLNVTRRDHVHEVSRKDLVGGNSERTGELVIAALKKATGGVLLVTDAGAYCEKTDHYGILALGLVVGHFADQAERIAEEASAAAKERAKAAARGAKPPPLKADSEAANNTILLLSTQRDKLPSLHAAVPALSAVEGSQLEFMDYAPEEMAALVRVATEERGFMIHKDLTSEKLLELLKGPIAKCAADKGGKLLVERLVEAAINKQTDRVHLSGTRSKDSLLSLAEADFTEEDTSASGENMESVLAKLDAVIGLAGVKKHVRSLVAQLQLAEKKKMAGVQGAKVNATMHMVFSGNPGTGKTTIARMIAELLQGLGYLKRGHLVETDRSGMVAPFVGQTAIKTQEVVESAVGGMLFVDEAYALVKDAKDSFGKEALDTLIKLVEDKRDELVVVLAGYPAEMDELMAHNPGVRSRFPTVITFEDYNVAELMHIADGFVKKQHLKMTEEGSDLLAKKLGAMVSSPDVQNGNGRAVRNMVEQAMRAQALRLSENDRATMKPSELSVLTAADFV